MNATPFLVEVVELKYVLSYWYPLRTGKTIFFLILIWQGLIDRDKKKEAEFSKNRGNERN